MDTKQKQEGILRMRIIKLVRENPNGLPYTQIANELETTVYRIVKEVQNLVGLGELQVIEINQKLSLVKTK